MKQARKAHGRRWERTLCARWLSMIVLAAGSCPAALYAQDQPEILAEVDRRQVFVGETVAYRVLLNHFPADAKLRLAESDDFRARLLQQSQANSTLVQSDGIREQRIVRRGPLFEYALTPQRAGRLTVPAVEAELDGTTYRSQPQTIEALAVQEQDLALLEVHVEPERIYPTQPFTVHLALAVRGLPPPLSDRDPLSVQQQLPSLSVPWVEDAGLPPGLEPSQPWTQWLNDYVAERDAGFAINDLQGRRDLFSDLFDRDPLSLLLDEPLERIRDQRLPFRPPPQQRQRHGIDGQMLTYWEYHLPRRFVASRAGRYSLGTATVKGTFGEKATQGGTVEGRTVFVAAKPVEIVVAEPPLRGRPPSFTGAIGQFRVVADVRPRQARVGDPLKVTITLEGQGALDRALPPALAEQPAVTAGFKVYDVASRTEQGIRQFTYGVRPKHAGVRAFPAVDVAFFDPQQEEYVVARTPLIPLEIQPAQALPENEIALALPAAQPGNHPPQDGIFEHRGDAGTLYNERVSFIAWAAAMLSLGGLFLVITVSRNVWYRYYHDAAWRRRRIAERRVELRLDAAARHLENDDQRAAARECAAAMIGVVADLANIPEAACTSSDALDHLERDHVPAELRQRFGELLCDCDAAQFGGLSPRDSNLVDRTRTAVGELLELSRDGRWTG